MSEGRNAEKSAIGKVEAFADHVAKCATCRPIIEAKGQPERLCDEGFAHFFMGSLIWSLISEQPARG